MNEQSIASTSFVISAVYTFTFANSVFFGIAEDPTKSFSPTNVSFVFQHIVCGLMCIILTLRCFFGNNNYIYNVLKKDELNHWVKFYHFSFIAIQSVILLISSYYVQTPFQYAASLVLFFAFELLWYLLTFAVHRDGVWMADPIERREMAVAQFYNAVLAGGIIFVSWSLDVWSDQAVTGTWLFWVIVLFAANTAYDAYKNMPGYMGTDTET